MNNSFLSDRLYKILFALLGLVYIMGLFVPLMDNDSGHHADIALHMYLTGNYVDLVDQAGDYLDKPHLHFWLCAFSYKIFGVTTFAYKFPSFLFTLLGIYSVYRLGKILYSNEIGKLSALILASSFAFILANNDVRMDAILTACIAFASWQLVEFIQQKKIVNVAGAALGLALGFSTKGHIALFVPAAAAFFYILYIKEWRLFFNWKWFLLLVLFALLISPVVYCYYLQYNLHPETMVRGRGHINGVRFILFGQSVERFRGNNFGGDSKHDYLFFLHSFLWAFAPWSILAYIAIFNRIKNFLSRKDEWLSTGVFVIVLLVVSFSGFKLPHYLNIVFPFTALIVADFIPGNKNNPAWIKAIFIIQLFVSALLLLVSVVINIWAFPIKNIWVIISLILLLAFVFYFIKSKTYSMLQKSVLIPVATVVFAFFLLNGNFYPQLLKFQGGNELAFQTKKKVDPDDVYFWNNTFSSSYNFYTKTIRRQLADSVIQPNKKIWLMADIKSLDEIKNNYVLGESYSVLDYEITKLDIRFIDPDKRESQCTRLMLVELLSKK